MRKALEELKKDQKFKKNSSTSKTLDELTIEPTHLYVMYDLQSEEEEANLKADSSIVVFDYPLDYEFTDEQLDSRPALAEGQIPEYFAAIKIGSDEEAEHQYTLLEELYIPEEDEYFNDPSQTTGKSTDPNEIASREDLLRHLLHKAYELTGNEYELDNQPTQNGKWIFGTKWYPSGNIQVYDEIVGRNVPVTGAQVLMRQWFTVRQGITDGNGNFSTGFVRGKAIYILQWERYNYSIRNGSLFQAETRGPNVKQEAWSHTITGGDDKYHAIIHQAAHDYYYGHRFGLISPPMNNHIYSFGRQRQIKIAARETAPWGVPSSYSHIRSDLTFGLSAQIHIKAWGRDSDEVYGTTIHELSHALHSVLDRGSYDNIVRDSFLSTSSQVRNRNRRLLETWPTTVEILLTLDRYKTKFNKPNYKVYQDNNYQDYQNQKIASQNHYTSGGYDMIDNINQRLYYNDSSYPVDRVNGYTIKQLEQALIGARLWTGWRDNIKTKYNNPTEIYLDELFNNWQD
ncbi:hypothetical protein EG338_04895 [Kaistella haifensis]|nr:hypothetical protein EG338_04895 [Kaistella haifensis]